MDVNNLQVNTNIVGGYFSSEQIDLLSIIQCNDSNELIDFITHCDQLKYNYNKEELEKLITLPLDNQKKKFSSAIKIQWYIMMLIKKLKLIINLGIVAFKKMI